MAQAVLRTSAESAAERLASLDMHDDDRRFYKACLHLACPNQRCLGPMGVAELLWRATRYGAVR